jgi:predicted amidohydrolase
MVLESEAHEAHSETAPAIGGRRDEHAGRLCVAIAQMSPRLDLVTNLERHLQLIAEARSRGARLVVFPELSLTGYLLEDLVPEVSLRVDAPEIAQLVRACNGIDAVVGCILESDDMRFHNAALYISGGRVAHVHRKVYLPTYGLFDEHRYMAAGDCFRSFAVGADTAADRPWPAGMLICEDLWHPSAAVQLARQGVDVFICPSASPGRGVTRDHGLGTARSYDAMTRTYAQLFTAYIVYCNRVGYEDGVGYWGGSRVVAPDGTVVAEAQGRDETMVLYELERAAVRRARIAYPLLRDERHDVNDAESDRVRRIRAGD